MQGCFHTSTSHLSSMLTSSGQRHRRLLASGLSSPSSSSRPRIHKVKAAEDTPNEQGFPVEWKSPVTLGVVTAFSASLLAVGGAAYTDLRGVIKEQAQMQSQQFKEQAQMQSQQFKEQAQMQSQQFKEQAQMQAQQQAQQQAQLQALILKLDDLNGSVKFYTGETTILKEEVFSRRISRPMQALLNASSGKHQQQHSGKTNEQHDQHQPVETSVMTDDN